jgi:hypothetical protein
MVPDPGGPKTHGSSGSATLLAAVDHLKNDISPVEEENIQDAEDEEERELGGKEGEEPLARVHLGSQLYLL